MLTLEPTSSVLQLTLARGGACCHCDYSSAGTSDMLLHIIREHLRARIAGALVGGTLTQCDFCSSVFPSRDVFEEHFWEVHMAEVSVVASPVASKKMRKEAFKDDPSAVAAASGKVDFKRPKTEVTSYEDYEEDNNFGGEYGANVVEAIVKEEAADGELGNKRKMDDGEGGEELERGEGDDFGGGGGSSSGGMSKKARRAAAAAGLSPGASVEAQIRAGLRPDCQPSADDVAPTVPLEYDPNGESDDDEEEDYQKGVKREDRRKKGEGGDEEDEATTAADLIDPESGLLPDGRPYEEARRKEPCPICMKPVAENLFPSHVKSHWRIFNTNSHFCCKLCDAIFKDVELYKTHVDQLHPGTPKVLKIVYKCPICSLNYSKTGRVKDHILQVHTTARAYACKTCGKRFGSPTALGTHKKVHEVSFGPTLSIRCKLTYYGTQIRLWKSFTALPLYSFK